MPDPNLAEIRCILQRRPSRFSFHLLRALIDAVPSPVDRDRALGVAESSLARWPAWTRHISIDGCRRMRDLLGRPSWPLCRSLGWTAIAESDDLSIGRMTKELAADPNAARLRRLELDLPEDEVLSGLGLATNFPNLRRFSIDLGCDNRRENLIRLLVSDLPHRLRRLAVMGIDNLDDDPKSDAFDLVDAIASALAGSRLTSIRLPNVSGATFVHFLERFRRPLSDIGPQNWTMDTVGRLCRSSELAGGLKVLDFSGYDLGCRKLELIASSPHFRSLQSVNFGESTLGPEGVTILAASNFLPNLTRLNLDRNRLGDEGWDVLAGVPCRRLRSLDLSWSGGVSVQGARALARSENLSGLRSLHLDGNPIGDEGVREMMDAEFASGLHVLGLAGVEKTPATADLLASRPLRRLRALRIGVEKEESDFCRRLASSGPYPALTQMDLSSMNLGDQGVGHLAGATGFPALRRIDLCSNDLSDIGIRTLVDSPFVRPIREIRLRGNPGIGDAGIAALADSPFLTNIVGLGLDLGRLSEETREILRRSPPTRLLSNGLT